MFPIGVVLAATAALQASADGEGVHLQVVSRDEHRIWLSVLTERAAALQGVESGYADELARVTGADDASVGVPADAIPHVVSRRHSDVTLRDFELLEPGSLEIPESADEHPAWCILWTERDARMTGCALGKPCPGSCLMLPSGVWPPAFNPNRSRSR